MRSLCSFLEQPRTHAKTLQERILLQTVLLMLAVLLAGFSYLNEYSLTGICIGDTGDVSGVVCLLSIL
jgi:hypothetical protein